METIEKFDIDDDFDPLEDISDGVCNDDGYSSDYQLPAIPDADKSIVVDPVPLSAEERIDALFRGMPGQADRLLFAIESARSETESQELVNLIEEAYPARTSVFSVARILSLLERAGALSLREDMPACDEAGNSFEESCAEAGKADSDFGFDLGEEPRYLPVEEAPLQYYTATPEGIKALEYRSAVESVLPTLTEEPEYLRIYKQVLEMVSAEGGVGMKELDCAVNGDPLLQNPRRFCGYFLDRLERAGAVRFTDSWRITELGLAVLHSDVFDR